MGEISDNEQNTRDQIMAFLKSDDYFAVQEALVFLEAHTYRLRIIGIENLRNVLDHLVRAAHSADSPDKTAHHLAEAKEHLRRALSMTYQDEIQERLWQLEQSGRGYVIRRALFPEIPTEREFKEQLHQAKELLAKAKLLKSDHTRIAESAKILRACLETLEQLALKMRAKSSGLIRFIVILFLLILVGLTGTILVVLFTLVVALIHSLFP
jgi:hypothetical protein